MKTLPMLPPMRCDRGCGDCCGPAVCSATEFATIRAYIAEHGIVPRRQGITCPVYLDGQCAVYEVRPTICRLFGHVPQMVCSRGYNVQASQQQRRPYDLAIMRLRREGRERFTHELVYSEGELADILAQAAQ